MSASGGEGLRRPTAAELARAPYWRCFRSREHTLDRCRLVLVQVKDSHSSKVGCDGLGGLGEHLARS